jgi:hypothetical protein
MLHINYEPFSLNLLHVICHYRVAQKIYTLFTHQYLWNKLWQCLDADGGHFKHLHWIQNSRTSLISNFLLYKYSTYHYRVIFFISKCVYIILGYSVYRYNILQPINFPWEEQRSIDWCISVCVYTDVKFWIRSNFHENRGKCVTGGFPSITDFKFLCYGITIQPTVKNVK